MGPIPGLRRSPGEGNGNALQYSCLENLMDRGAWQANSPQGRKELDMSDDFTLLGSYLLAHFNSLLLLTHISNFLFYLTRNNYCILQSVS